ncbi:MAG: hypothetical protein ACRDO7_09285 [Nocardioidaceae bacterium]
MFGVEKVDAGDEPFDEGFGLVGGSGGDESGDVVGDGVEVGLSGHGRLGLDGGSEVLLAAA